MYHIKNDKRSQKSSELIYAGLTKCMEEKEFDKITITDIQAASTVGRATFYRNFDNVTDVLYWQCDIHYKEVMNGYLNQTRNFNDPYQFLHYFFDYWLSNSQILEQIIAIGHYDIIFHCHFSSSYIITNSIQSQLAEENHFYEYYMSGLIGAFVGVLITWISKGKALSADELINMFKSNGNQDILKFFL